jgi:hypothetical protein
MTRWRGRFKSLRIGARDSVVGTPLRRSVSFPSPMESLATAVKSAEGAKKRRSRAISRATRVDTRAVTCGARWKAREENSCQK